MSNYCNPWEAIAKQLASKPTGRDTSCKQCGKWTHMISPGGLGVIFCSANCEQVYKKIKY